MSLLSSFYFFRNLCLSLGAPGLTLCIALFAAGVVFVDVFGPKIERDLAEYDRRKKGGKDE